MPSRNGPLPRAQATPPNETACRGDRGAAGAHRLGEHAARRRPAVVGRARVPAHGPLQAAGGADDAGPADPNR